MATKGVRNSTLQKKCKRWAKALRLSDWDIICRYATRAEMERECELDRGENCFDDTTIGHLHECSIPEKIALILIRRNYYAHESHGISWNIDTLILHELIHIIEIVGTNKLPKKITERKDFCEFEEYNCDSFSAILYFLYYNRM